MKFFNQMQWQMIKINHTRLRTYSTIVSLSAISPRTMRCIILLCSSSDRFLYDTRGILYFVAGEGSTPWSHAWFSISSKDALRFGSLCNIRVIRLWIKNKAKQNALTCLNSSHCKSNIKKQFSTVSPERSLEMSTVNNGRRTSLFSKTFQIFLSWNYLLKTINNINTIVFIYYA